MDVSLAAVCFVEKGEASVFRGKDLSGDGLPIEDKRKQIVPFYTQKSSASRRCSKENLASSWDTKKQPVLF